MASICSFCYVTAQPRNSLGEFHKRIDQFLDQFETNARHLGKSPEDISDAKYAFCALIGRDHSFI